MNIAEINFLDINENEEYIKILTKILKKCFEEEGLLDKKQMYFLFQCLKKMN